MRNSAGSKFSSATSFRPSLCQDQHHQFMHFYYDFCMAFNQALTIMASATFGLYCQSGRPRWECRPTFSWGCWQSCPWWSRASGWSPRAPPSCGAPSRQLEITLLCPQAQAQLPNCHSSMHTVDCPGRGPTWTGAVAASWAGCGSGRITAGALSLESRTPPLLLQPAWPRTPEYVHQRPYTCCFDSQNHCWY